MSEVRLRDLPVGGTACVTGIRDTHRSYRSKLLSMGLTRGTPLRVERIAPLGDPVHVTVRGFSLSLRGSEADALQLERLDQGEHDAGAHDCCGGHGRHRRARHGHRHGGTI